MGIQDILERARESMTSAVVFGDPVRQDGITVIPAARVSGGGGGGEGGPAESDVQGAGGGFGLTASPVGAYVIRDGRVSWRPAVDVNRAIAVGAVLGIAALLVARGVLRQRAAG
jgi:uncharacterized spore protein YtfJ